MGNYLIFISHKRHSRKYLYFMPNAESTLKAQLDAWHEFQRMYLASEDDWLLRSVELSMDSGLQFVEVL